VTVSPARILIIEEDVAVGQVMRDLLVEGGFQVTLGRHVLSMRDVSRIRPHLLILDLMLDGTDARWALLLALGSNADTSWIPVLVCMAHDTLVRREELQLQVLAASVLRKPFEVGELLDAIAGAIGSSQR
jgi:DNA-binding response OmpR family regulator